MGYEAFLDESGQRELNDKTDRYYVVAGVIVRVAEVAALEHELRGLKRAFFSDPTVEVKSNWIRRPKQCQERYLVPSGRSAEEFRDFVDHVYDWICSTDAVFISAVVDKLQLVKDYVRPDAPHAIAHQMFLQRFEKFLARRRGRGRLSYDRTSGRARSGVPQEELLRRQHARALEVGCPYTKMQYSRIDEDLSFFDSRSFGLLQIADLVAYNVFRQFREHGRTWDDPAAKVLPRYPHFARILPRFDRSSTGILAGYGLAKFPRRSNNRWVA